MANKYTIVFTKEAVKDIKKLTPKSQKKLCLLLNEIIAHNPYVGKKLMGDLIGFYSYRLSYQDRIVYTIEKNRLLVTVYRTKTHYGD